MEGAEEELERRSMFLKSLIQKKKAIEQQEQHDHLRNNVRIRACDMPLPLQNRAFRCARDILDSMPGKKLDSKRLALALKKEFDSSYGPAWHCIVGTSFGSYVTYSLGGFLYFSIDKVGRGIPEYLREHISHSLIIAQLGAYKQLADLDDAQISLLAKAIAVYPHLWNFCGKFSERFQALMLRTLADMLLFLRDESPINVTSQREKEFHRLCDAAVQLGFERSWVDEMRQRVMVRDPEVDHARAQLSTLRERHDHLTLGASQDKG